MMLVIKKSEEKTVFEEIHTWMGHTNQYKISCLFIFKCITGRGVCVCVYVCVCGPMCACVCVPQFLCNVHKKS